MRPISVHAVRLAFYRVARIAFQGGEREGTVNIRNTGDPKANAEHGKRPPTRKGRL